MNVINHIKQTRKVAGLFRNRWSEMPFTISLALSGFAVQMYASYNLVKSSSGMRLRLPSMNYRIQDSRTIS